MTERICGNCRFWELFDDNDPDCREGECRRYPPSLVSNDQQINAGVGLEGSSSGIFIGWNPITYSSDWCGEWQEKTQ